MSAETRMWAAQILSTLSDYNRDHARAVRTNRGADKVIADATRYFSGNAGRARLDFAGVNPDMDVLLALITLPRAEFKARLTMDRKEEAA